MKPSASMLYTFLVFALLGSVFSDWATKQALHNLNPCPSPFINPLTSPLVSGSTEDSPEHQHRKAIIYGTDAYLAEIRDYSTGRLLCLAPIISTSKLLLPSDDSNCDWRTSQHTGSGLEAKIKCFGRDAVTGNVTQKYQLFNVGIKGITERHSEGLSLYTAIVSIEKLRKQCEVFFYHEAIRGKTPEVPEKIQVPEPAMLDLIYGRCPNGDRPDDAQENAQENDQENDQENLLRNEL